MRAARVLVLLLWTAAALGLQQAQPAFDEWTEDFDGKTLDSNLWESYTMGNGRGEVKVDGGQLRMRGATGSRSGVRTRKMFSADRFIVEGKLAKVGERFPDPGSNDNVGNAIVAVLFGGSDTHRIEWILRSDGLCEAWFIQRDRPGERLDNRHLATREKAPMLGIVRR